MGFLTKVFGTHSERELKLIYPLVDKIEALRPEMMKLSDEELKGKTREFKQRLADGETLDDLLVEAFAAVREAARRVLGMEHYRVQLIGGIILHQGRIAEMKTGEGKTLVSTLPAYLNALEGKVAVLTKPVLLHWGEARTLVNAENGGVLDTVAELFDLPADLVAGLPHLEMVGSRQLYLEHHTGILSYSEEQIFEISELTHTPYDVVYLQKDSTLEDLSRYPVLFYPHPVIMTGERAELLKSI